MDKQILMRQGRNPQGRTPSFGPLPLVAQETRAHHARMSRSETLKSPHQHHDVRQGIC